MLVQHPLDAFWVEVTTLSSGRIQQDGHDQVFQFVPHPVPKRQREPLFRPIKNFPRHAQLFRELGEDVLLFLSPHLPFRWQAGDPFEQKMVKNWNSHFQRCEHTHPVDLRENVPRKVSLRIEIKYTAQRIVSRSFMEKSTHRAHWIHLSKGCDPEVIREKSHFPVEWLKRNAFYV